MSEKDTGMGDRQKMKADAGIPDLPTDLTYDLRLAVAGEGPRAYEWSDKPHRLLYDACREVERLTALASREGWVMVGAIVSPFGDPEAFGEREVEIKADLMKFPYNTPLYALSSAPKPEEG